jgi:murein DD-endopeptidase MepM/ murein hydrolase activator NlpD
MDAQNNARTSGHNAAERTPCSWHREMSWVLWLVGALTMIGCHSTRTNPYESAPPGIVAGWKLVRLPLSSGTHFLVSQGAFGRNTHNQSGIEYRWDFDVPYGTQVVAVEAGTVIAVTEPHQGGGCDPRFSEVPNSMMIKHPDGTVAQYTHIDSRVVVGQAVARGDVIAVTGKNGFICTPQLDFLVYRSDQTLYDSPHRESIPLRFEGLPREQRATEGLSATVP